MTTSAKNSFLIIISALFLLSACTKTLENTGQLPEAGQVFENNANPDGTFSEDETSIAAETFFGSGAKGVASLIEKIYTTHGRPTAYITGYELSGAVVAGGRFGEGTLHHKLEGSREIKWAGPSLGFDLGLSGGETFVLIYNLYDPEDIYQWMPAGEGQAYLIGGLNISYQGDQGIVIVTIRMGVGMRLGVNVGVNRYIKVKASEPQGAGTEG
jgi:hypothetical protein